MATALKLRRGTTTQHDTFTGVEAEVTVDTTKDTIVVHDGTTVGGHPLAKSSEVAGKANTNGDNATGTWPVNISGNAATAGSADSATTASTVSDGAITTNKLAATSVTAEKLAINSVTAAKIANGAITSDKLTTGSVTSDKIATGAFTGDALADESISNSKIANNTIALAKISTGAYGTSGASKLLQIDSDGKLPAIDGSKLTNLPFPSSGVTSLNGQTGAITNTNYNSIGSYAIASYTAPTTNGPNQANGAIVSTNPSGASGTWRKMGQLSLSSSVGINTYSNLVVRVS